MKKVFEIADRIRAKLAIDPPPTDPPPPEPSEEELTDPESKMETIPAPPPSEVAEELGEELIVGEFTAGELDLMANGLDKLEAYIYDVAEDTSKFKDVFENMRALKSKLNELKSGG